MNDIEVACIGPIESEDDLCTIINALWLMSVPEKMYKILGNEKRYCVVRNVDEANKDRFFKDFKESYYYLKTLK